MILKGWKDIAKHLGCGMRTVQRWEKLGMPVRRPSGHRRSAVMAISEELDLWLRQGLPATNDATTSKVTTKPSQRFRYRILLADNDEELLVSVAARLANEGYDVRTTRDGFEALAAMREASPDLLVSDLRMPNMSGFELLGIIRKRFPAMAVIVCSDEFAAAGNPHLLCDRYVEKNRNSSSTLMDAIRELVSQSPLRAQLAKSVIAPAWIPRAINGYFVLTCTDCLRSFSVLTRTAVIGREAAAQCSHCGVDVKYHIEDSVLRIRDDLTALLQYTEKRIASVRAGRRHPARRRPAKRKSH